MVLQTRFIPDTILNEEPVKLSQKYIKIINQHNQVGITSGIKGLFNIRKTY